MPPFTFQRCGWRVGQGYAAAALDSISTLTIGELMISLKAHFTLVLVTHNMQQAACVSDDTAFFHQGMLVEFAATERLFTHRHSAKPRNTSPACCVSGVTN